MQNKLHFYMQTTPLSSVVAAALVPLPLKPTIVEARPNPVEK